MNTLILAAGAAVKNACHIFHCRLLHFSTTCSYFMSTNLPFSLCRVCFDSLCLFPYLHLHLIQKLKFYSLAHCQIQQLRLSNSTKQRARSKAIEQYFTSLVLGGRFVGCRSYILLFVDTEIIFP